MQFKNFLLLFSLMLAVLMCINATAAIEDANYDYNISDDTNELSLQDNRDDLNDILSSSSQETLSEPKTIVVEEVEKDHNEMSDPTIQKAIDSANAGDTIVINGTSYVHCHFVIDKQLTIRSEVGTTMEVCPGSTAGSGYKGIFYLSPKASGTVIEGFTISNNVYNENDYGILVNGASDVIIRDCEIANTDSADAIRIENAKNVNVENVTLSNAVNGIRIRNSENMAISKVRVSGCDNGINVIDSTQTRVEYSDFNKNDVAGISYSGNGKFLTLIYNNITKNGDGIRLTSSDQIYILSNYISFNRNNGVYVDYNITKIEIKGNFFNQNTKWEVFNDFHVKNINDVSIKNANNLEVITNNYMINYGGYGTGDMDRPVWTQVYVYNTKIGSYDYDSANDVYVYVGEGKGSYDGHQGIMFLGYVFEINEFVSCPNLYFSPQKIWSKSGNYELQLSEITQDKKGIYSISIVDADGNIASELSSVPVTFYLNKAGNSATPQEGDVYKTVMMKNGTATVRFYADDFLESGNIVTAVLPTPGSAIDSKVSKTFSVGDENIPGIVTNTSISVSGLNTYPKSGEYLIANLTDIEGNAIAGQIVQFKLNSQTYNVTTDEIGQVKLPVSISKEGNYVTEISFVGDDIDFASSKAKCSVVVKKQTSKIISSNANMIPKMAEYYSITLKDGLGKVIANQKVTFNVNGKTYTKKTNSNGVAKVKVKFTKNKKTYKITMKFAGNDKYNAVSKTNKITVKYSSKNVKLIAPSVNIPPKTTSKYTVTLKDGNGKGISKQKVIIKINGKKYTKKTNAKGQVTIKVKFSKMKTYKASATYAGSKIYKKASVTGKIKVAKTTTKITAPSVSILPKESKTYTVTLKAGSKVLSKQKLTIKVNGKTYTKKTNAKGQAGVSVKFNAEKTYPIVVNYKGTAIYKASKATGKITVSKLGCEIESYDKTFSSDSQKDYKITLRDIHGNGLAGESITYTLNGESNTQTTDSNGQIEIDLTQIEQSSDILFKYGGSDKYKTVSKSNKITVVNGTNVTFVDSDLPNSEIQNILDSATDGTNVEFLGDYYFGISLDVNKALNIHSSDRTILNAKDSSPVFNVKSDGVSISGFSLKGNSGDAIQINNASDVTISDNFISNSLDESLTETYVDGTVNMPGYGINISNSSNVKISHNSISLFESGIFVQYSSNLIIDNNTLREDNYGIKYGFGVANTQIINNEITNLIGLYIMTVPEGPSGYGIFLNNSAVNVTVNSNHIAYNHLGISLDANHSTGIVITQNVITDNVLEGIRFNAGYDLAENAVEPVVTDNAVYRNARGPSMMILGELSANPEGIYGGGLLNPEERLKLDPNWYGTNNVETWDYDSGVVGYGTMCPRINTTGITFNMSYNSYGNYSVVFYKKGVLASNLPIFDMFATLNRGTDKQVEVNFNVVNGVGTLNFDASNYNVDNNKIEISIGSLLNSTSRTFKVTYLYNIGESEIPA